MTYARCWVALPSSLPPHHLPRSRPRLHTPCSFCSARWVRPGLSAPPISAPPRSRLPFSPPAPLPCLALPALHFARMLGAQEGQCAVPPPFRSRAAVPSAPAASRPGCTPSTPFARTLEAGRTERPPFPFARRPLRPAAPSRLTRYPPRARPPPPFARMRGEGQEGQCAPTLPFADRKSVV